MFQEIITRLETVTRFDRAANTRDIKIGEMERTGGGTALALAIPSGEAFEVEHRAQNQLLSQFKIPSEHFDRLPRELQAAELRHFFQAQPKDVTIRAASAPGVAQPTARAFVSGLYEDFDHAEALRVAMGTLKGDWEIAEDKAERDEMRILITQPQLHDVSARRTGDLVKLGLSIRNSEIGTGALGVEFCTFRLVCLNGMIAQQAAVSVRQRHIHIDKESFRIQLKNAITNVAEIGQVVIQQIRASHDLRLPNLDPDAGKLQREVVGILRRSNILTKEFTEKATATLGRDEEASVFGLVQFITGPWAKSRSSVMERLGVERVAGALMGLAA